MRRRTLLVVALAVLASGCAHGGVDIATLASNSDQAIWEAGQKALKKHDYEAARQLLKRLIEGFPQSEYGADARLALADSHFQEGGTANYVLAISEYRNFLTLYPSHARSDYAQLQMAEAFFKQKNGPDRDQTQTEKALEEYERLLQLYPSSPHAETARKRVVELRQGLAAHEFQVGYFYQRARLAYRAAIARYDGILSHYPDYVGTNEVLFRLAECLALSGRGAEALPYLHRLLEEYPNSDKADAARRLMETLSRPAPKASPMPTPLPGPQPTPTPTPQPTPLPGPSSSPEDSHRTAEAQVSL